MHINMTARHLELTSALADYVQKKVERAQRYFNHLIWAQVILDVQKHRHMAEVIIHGTGHTLRAKQEAGDLYAAIDVAMDKMDKQVKRFKERLKVHHRGEATPRRLTGAVPISDLGVLTTPSGSDGRIRTRRLLRLSPMTEDEAIQALEQSEASHWIFLNARTRRVCVLYRKNNKTYELVEAVP